MKDCERKKESKKGRKKERKKDKPIKYENKDSQRKKE